MALRDLDQTFVEGDLLVVGAGGVVQALPVGANGRYLKVNTAVDGKIEAAVVTGFATAAHQGQHTDGSDDIQSATSGQKGLATAAQITKLDGIEAAADVTDAVNVNAAGAVMESDFTAANLFPVSTAASTVVMKERLTAYKTTDETKTTDTTFAIDSELSVTVSTNKTYRVEMYLAYDSDVTPDFKMQMPPPAASVMSLTGLICRDSATYQLTIVWDETQYSNTWPAASTADHGLIMRGTLKTAGTGGTFGPEWAQRVSDAAPTTVHRGSYLLLEEL